jgi:hypothetical protein
MMELLCFLVILCAVCEVYLIDLVVKALRGQLGNSY